MNNEIQVIPSGTVTSPKGFQAGTVSAGIKESAADKLDLGILFSEAPCTAAAVFTSNRIKAASVILSQQRLQNGKAVAVVVNSGCANACVGELGMADTIEMAELAAEKIGVSPDAMLVASTGVIGSRLPMDKIRAGMSRVALSREGGIDFARAIMTTDTVFKQVAVRAGDEGFIIGGVAKGSGMIHPDMATLLVFLTTDTSVESSFLKQALKKAVDISFNMVSIDCDTSTNDMVLLMANGMAGNEPVSESSRQAEIFQQALNQVCTHLARAVARDGEGATKLIEVTVRGAASASDAKLAARTIAGSPLVKSAVYGNDPNWGRVMMAVGRSGVEVVEEKIDLYMGGIFMAKAGCAVAYKKEDAVNALKGPDVLIDLNLNIGSGVATAWGCDLTEEYVKINAEYTT